MVFFGGFGEPLMHPDIVAMVTQAKALGGSVELITNGTMLTRAMSRQLVAAGLDMLWVSLDGATPASYADVRLGAALPEVLANLIAFREERWITGRVTTLAGQRIPELGIVFVAMKRNIADLPQVLQLRGVSRFVVTNVLPYTPEMTQEALYFRSGKSKIRWVSLRHAELHLPRIDLDSTTREALYWALHDRHSISWAGVHLGEGLDRCPFIKNGATAISWEGNLSPCLPLLHTHISFLDKRERFSQRHVQRYIIGNINEDDLQDLWNKPDYIAFREKVQNFDFAVCASCGACELAEKNEEDCFGGKFPSCGGCLWAKGIIFCP
jgi:MoaA/NifB/PqqE/SkfB family radical SAM enzyme